MGNADNNDIVVDYQEVWTVNVGGDGELMMKQHHLEYIGWEEESEDDVNTFKGDYMRLKKREDYQHDGDVKSRITQTQSKVHFSTIQTSWTG